MCFESTGTDVAGGQEVRRATAVNPADEPKNPWAEGLKGFGKKQADSNITWTPGSTDIFNYQSTGVQSPLLMQSLWKRPNNNGLGN